MFISRCTIRAVNRNKYIGPRNEQTERLMCDHAEGKSDVAEMGEKLKRMSIQVQAGVKMPTDKAVTRVIRSLADAGVFRNGGVLLGTHAFQAAGLMLGVSWTIDAARTADIDLAVHKVSVAIPKIDSDIPAGYCQRICTQRTFSHRPFHTLPRQ